MLSIRVGEICVIHIHCTLYIVQLLYYISMVHSQWTICIIKGWSYQQIRIGVCYIEFYESLAFYLFVFSLQRVACKGLPIVSSGEGRCMGIVGERGE